MKKIKLNESVIFDNTFYDMACGKIINPVRTGDFSVIQAVDSLYFGKCTISSHTQNCDFEITTVLDGTLENRNGEHVFALQKKRNRFLLFKRIARLVLSENVPLFNACL